MTGSFWKWLQRPAVRAGRIRSMGCRGYLVELDLPAGPKVLSDRSGRPRRFPTLDGARRALRRRGVWRPQLVHRDASEELG